MTCCSCLFGAFMMPLNIFIWARFIDENAEAVFPFSKITVNILITLVPVVFGFFIRKYFSAYVKIIKKVCVFKIGFIIFFLLILMLKDSFYDLLVVSTSSLTMIWFLYLFTSLFY